MGDKSKIEWTDASWNPVVGCSRVSAGCDNCYAIRQAYRVQAMQGDSSPYAGTTRKRKSGELDWTGVVKVVPERLDQPLRWRRPRRIFVNSMSDLFHPAVPFEDIDQVWRVMADSPHHTFQVLTKRPERMAEYLTKHENVYNETCAWAGATVLIDFLWPLPNIWLGTSCENQAAADERIPHLLRCPAAVRFLSCEPLLGPVDLAPFIPMGPGHDPRGDHWCVECSRWKGAVDWVIVGSESGQHRRPCDPSWIRSIRDQCEAASAPCFIKQIPIDGQVSKEMNGWPEDLRIRQFPEVEHVS